MICAQWGHDSATTPRSVISVAAPQNLRIVRRSQCRKSLIPLGHRTS
jgi:hypothetical protein